MKKWWKTYSNTYQHHHRVFKYQGLRIWHRHVHTIITFSYRDHFTFPTFKTLALLPCAGYYYYFFSARDIPQIHLLLGKSKLRKCFKKIKLILPVWSILLIHWQVKYMPTCMDISKFRYLAHKLKFSWNSYTQEIMLFDKISYIIEKHEVIYSIPMTIVCMQNVS